MTRRTLARRMLALCSAATLALGAAACGDDDGGGSDAATIKLGYVTPAAHPYGQAVDRFVALAEEKSGGSLEFETLPSYSGGDVPLLDDVIAGTVQAASVSSAVWGAKGVTSFDALQAPFLITRYDLEDQVISGEIGTEMLAGVEKLGLVGLAIHEGGLRKPLGAKKPITTLADFKNLKIRSVQSPVLQAGLEALGASPTPIPVTEIYTSLRNGTVDAMESNLGLTQTFKLYEVAKFTTLNVNLWPFPTVLVMNKSVFDGLSDAQKTAITDAAKEIPSFSIGIFTDPKNNLIPTLCEEGHKFAAAKPADLQAMAAATAKVGEKLAADDPATGDFITRITALRDALPAPSAPAPLPAGCAAT